MTDKPTHEIHYEPLTPTGFFMGRLDISKVPIDKACAWVKDNRSREGSHRIQYSPTQREDIPLGDEKVAVNLCMMRLMIL